MLKVLEIQLLISYYKKQLQIEPNLAYSHMLAHNRLKLKELR